MDGDIETGSLGAGSETRRHPALDSELQRSSGEGNSTASITSATESVRTTSTAFIDDGRGPPIERLPPSESLETISTQWSRSVPPNGGGWTVEQGNQIRFSPDDPGHWALNHHLSNLVFELHPPKQKPVKWLVAWLTSLLRDGRIRRPKPSSPTERRFRIDFAELQRMKLRKLRCAVIADVVYMRNHGVEAAGWEANLEKYVSTLKEYDYMVQRARESRDPFFATGEYLVDNLVLKRCLPPELLSQPLRKVNSVWEWETEGAKQLTIVGTRGANLSKTWVFNFRRRAVIAAVGGMFLVGPMWLMVLRSELITQLVATTVFVTGFGLLMAAFLDKDEAVLASTAAYAAVLVVFVGTSIGNDSGGGTR